MRGGEEKSGKYELGRTIGEGTLAKVKFARNVDTGESVAIKVLARSTILKHKMISIMKIVRHPCMVLVRLHEVSASQTKIYIVLEFVTGGELFDKIVHRGRLSENESRRYFQQLIDAGLHCHSKGAYHRDLKTENLLLDSKGNLKGVDLLHKTCGTPNYLATDHFKTLKKKENCCSLAAINLQLQLLLSSKALSLLNFMPDVFENIVFSRSWQGGYDVAAADVWSCSVILYVLMAGYLPFEEKDLPSLYNKVNDKYVREEPWDNDSGALIMNAFEMVTLSQGLNLSALFDRRQDYVRRQTRFVSRQPAKVIIAAIEAAAESMGLKVHTRSYKTRLEGVSANRASQFAVVLEVYEVAPSLFMVDVRKAAGDTLEYHKFYKNFCTMIDHIIWKPKEGMANSALLRTMAS
ncbi:Ca2+/calmodulin-dependent protein kinase, EF-Hand protein superfamily [Handroanthus impetiginosus]|uniref:non-specific serine/threonine protein kinase n=1 Tax=Handroanthus impetiginosus TaxID=429701 RepID=A0A2G9IAD3_9LAMI|nr:Ca2+/calmodulin-dependent protein kinase, EF-Hand protein superfamily [Handroanthus impetiginosus]